MAIAIPSIYFLALHKPHNFKETPSLRFIKASARAKTHQCHSSSNSYDDLSKELETEKKKIKIQRLQRLDAMKKSRQLLFAALCQHLDLRVDEAKRKWGVLKEAEKVDWVRGFVAEWGISFHPLSVKSVKAMVEEHLQEENPPPPSSSSSNVLKKLMEFFSDKRN